MTTREEVMKRQMTLAKNTEILRNLEALNMLDYSQVIKSLELNLYTFPVASCYGNIVKFKKFIVDEYIKINGHDVILNPDLVDIEIEYEYTFNGKRIFVSAALSKDDSINIFFTPGSAIFNGEVFDKHLLVAYQLPHIDGNQFYHDYTQLIQVYKNSPRCIEYETKDPMNLFDKYINMFHNHLINISHIEAGIDIEQLIHIR